MKVLFLPAVLALSMGVLFASNGENSFAARCVTCHGNDGAGSDRAGSILPTIHSKTAEELRTIITEGVSSKGMPAFEIPTVELDLLVKHLPEA